MLIAGKFTNVSQSRDVGVARIVELDMHNHDLHSGKEISRTSRSRRAVLLANPLPTPTSEEMLDGACTCRPITAVVGISNPHVLVPGPNLPALQPDWRHRPSSPFLFFPCSVSPNDDPAGVTESELLDPWRGVPRVTPHPASPTMLFSIPATRLSALELLPIVHSTGILLRIHKEDHILISLVIDYWR